MSTGAVTIANFAAAAAAVNASAGTITVTDATLAIATRSTEVVVTNTSVLADSVISLSLENSGTGEPMAFLTAVAAGTFTFVVYSPITAIGATPLDVHFSIL